MFLRLKEIVVYLQFGLRGIRIEKILDIIFGNADTEIRWTFWNWAFMYRS